MENTGPEIRKTLDLEHLDPEHLVALRTRMEHTLSDALPIDSGGLVDVAGDRLGAARGLGIPVVLHEEDKI